MFVLCHFKENRATKGSYDKKKYTSGDFGISMFLSLKIIPSGRTTGILAGARE